MGCNPQHDEFLIAQGYEHSAHVMMLTEHDLQDIPNATLPEGFRFYDATADDLENLADVHNHSFTNKWNVELYGRVFNAPLMEYEIVTVAPDGRFAAFTNVWVDEVNHTIVFEPMGTHSDFRRMGIGKAMMVYVLKRMQAEHGIQCAYVCHELADKNPASGALYRSVCEAWYGLRPYPTNNNCSGSSACSVRVKIQLVPHLFYKLLKWRRLYEYCNLHRGSLFVLGH